jgi:2,5-furandicarboxylate decarboxylase 1
VHLSMGGTGRFHLYVQIQKRMEGEGKKILLAAMAQHFDFKKFMLVDEDIDIFSSLDLEWAMATRFQADVIISGAQCSKLDPAAVDGFGAKLGIDATKPLDADVMRFKRTRVPGEENVDVQQLLMTTAPADWRSAAGIS